MIYAVNIRKTRMSTAKAIPENLPRYVFEVLAGVYCGPYLSLGNCVQRTTSTLSVLIAYCVKVGLILCGVGLGLFVLNQLVPWDRTVSALFAAFADAPWVDWSNRSFFEGDAVGLTDFPAMVVLCALLLVVLAQLGWRTARRYYMQASYVAFSSLILALCVHLLKGMVSRARPYDVAPDLMAPVFADPMTWHFSAWGVGSFPSGHTASVAGLFTLLFIFPRLRLVLFCLISAGLAMVMFSRIAVLAHWLTDTLASIALSAAVLIWLKRLFYLPSCLSVPGVKLFEIGQIWNQFPQVALLLCLPLGPCFVYVRGDSFLWLGGALLSSVLAMSWLLWRIECRAQKRFLAIQRVVQ